MFNTFTLIKVTSTQTMPFLPGKRLNLLLAGILAFILAACGGGSGDTGGGGGGGGGGGVAQCSLTEEQRDNLTPDDLDSLPPECDFLATTPLVGLFILGTEIDQANGSLRLYVHGVNQDGSPMTLADFEQATVTVGGNAVADWNVASAPAGKLSMTLLADYSLSITDADVIGIGDLYDIILTNAPAGFEAEIINFSSEPGASPTDPAITVKPEPYPYWTEDKIALQAANDFDDTQSRNNTTLFDAMGIALVGPLHPIINPVFDPLTDNLGLVERNGPLAPVGTRPATLVMVQSDGNDNDSQSLDLNDLTGLLDRCHTTVIVMGTYQSTLDVEVLDALAGTRGAFKQALNTNFLQPAMEPYARSLGNLAVFTLSAATQFAGNTVRIEVDGLAQEATEYMGSFDIDGNCQTILPIP
jgi:hypothetical protein